MCVTVATHAVWCETAYMSIKKCVVTQKKQAATARSIPEGRRNVCRLNQRLCREGVSEGNANCRARCAGVSRKKCGLKASLLESNQPVRDPPPGADDQAQALWREKRDPSSGHIVKTGKTVSLSHVKAYDRKSGQTRLPGWDPQRNQSTREMGETRPQTYQTELDRLTRRSGNSVIGD